MYTPLNILTVGGDARLALAAELLRADGHTALSLACENAANVLPPPDPAAALAEADVLLLPVPAMAADGCIAAPLSREHIAPGDLFRRLRAGTLVAAGKVTRTLEDAAAAHSITLCDYAAREEFAVANAAPTAEGALELALRLLPITLADTNALILGAGRIAKLLMLKLRALGCNVTAAARRYSDIAWIRAFGCTPCPFPRVEDAMARADVVFNTVPAPVIGHAELARLAEGVPIIDLASAPGGVDATAARDFGANVIPALSLPGKVAPRTAARIITDTLYNILDER